MKPVTFSQLITHFLTFSFWQLNLLQPEKEKKVSLFIIPEWCGFDRERSKAEDIVWQIYPTVKFYRQSKNKRLQKRKKACCSRLDAHGHSCPSDRQFLEAKM